MNMFGMKKGQGATEYLVLLAVVLIVAMVAIALLGFFPGITGNVQADQSKAYWTGVAKPFSIAEHKVTSTGAGSFVLVNTDADTRTITSFVVGGGSNTTSTTFAGGERKVMTMSGISPNCTSGKPYQYKVNITYSNADGSLTGILEVGAKDLIGTCT